MIKKIVLIIYVSIILIDVSCSREYRIKNIKIDKIDYSKSCKIYNDIRYLDGYLYIYTTKDISNEHYSGGEGILNSIIQLDQKYNVIQKNVVKNKFGFDYDYKYYYIGEDGNIIYHKLIDKLGAPISPIIEVYDNKGIYQKKIETKNGISFMNYFLDDNMLYYAGYKYAFGPDYNDFCIYSNDRIQKEMQYNEIGSSISFNAMVDEKNIYMLTHIDLTIFKKNIFLEDKNPSAYKIVNIDDFLYRKSNLKYFDESKYGFFVKNNIFYQIRFYYPSEKETINERSFVKQTSKSVQTLLIGVDLEKEELVKEIKINYDERYIYQSPNTFTVDDKGNIYILDSKNKNIIMIRSKAKKVEINYKY